MMLSRRVIPFAEPAAKALRNAGRPHQWVVQIGRDQELLRLRAKIIHSAGYSVHSLSPDQVTAELGNDRGAQVWVFCHTLELCELALLAVAVRNSSPADKLLRLTGLNDIGQASGLFDELLESVRGVEDLLSAVDRLVRQSVLIQ